MSFTHPGLIRTAGLAAVALCLFAGSAIAQQQGAPDMPARRACAADVKQFCSGVQPGGGRIIACLKENQTKLSPVCQQAMAAAQAARQGAAAQTPK